MTFVLPLAVPIIAGGLATATAGTVSWLNRRRHETPNIIGERSFQQVQRQQQEDSQINNLNNIRNNLLKQEEQRQFDAKIALAKQKIADIRSKQKPKQDDQQKPPEQIVLPPEPKPPQIQPKLSQQNQQAEQQKPPQDQPKQPEQSLAQKLKDVRQKIRDNAREETKGNDEHSRLIQDMVRRERLQYLHEEAELSRQYNVEQGIVDVPKPKPTKKEIAELKKLQADDKFQDKMNKMADIRQKRDQAQSTAEKDKYNKQLQDLRLKPKQVKDFSDDQLADIQQLNNEMQRISLNPNRIDEIMEQIQREGIQPYNAYSPQDPRNFLRRPIGEYNKYDPRKNDPDPDNEPNNDPNNGNNDPDPDPNNNGRNNYYIPQDQNQRFDYIQAFSRIMDVIQNKGNKPIESQHKEIDELTSNMDDNKSVNIYNMINNIQEHHVHHIESGDFDPDQLLTDTLVKY